jgi:hypothetical protein
MSPGMSKRQWGLVLMVLLVPFLLNAIGMWHQIRRDQLLEALKTGVYNRFGDSGVYYSPWPAIFRRILIAVLAGGLCWLAVFVSTRRFFQHLATRTKCILSSLLAVVLGALLAASSILLSSAWWWEFNHDYFVSGLGGSRFVNVASLVLVFPGTVLLMFHAFKLSEGKRQRVSAGLLERSDRKGK